MENFGSIDLLVSSAGIFSTKTFTEFTTDDFNALVSTNLLGFLYIFNAVAPGIVDTAMHKNDPKDFLRTLQPMGQIARVNDVIDAVVYLAHAGQVTGEVLHVDGGSHAGRW